MEPGDLVVFGSDLGVILGMIPRRVGRDPFPWYRVLLPSGVLQCCGVDLIPESKWAEYEPSQRKAISK